MKKANKQKKKNKKGFTLIELLAVIIILGILLLVAVPAVSRYIENSRKSTYISSVKSIVTAISTSVNALEYPAIGANEGLIVPFSEANLEKGTAKTNSPYAQYQEGKSYVLVTFDGQRYNYYVAALDEAGYAIPLINEKELSESFITTDTTIINNNIHSTSDIVDKELIDTSNLTFKYLNKIGEVIKVKMCELTYSIGNVVQLKDGSKWYVIADSDENSKTVNLLSYNHMETVENIGKQSSSKTQPTIQFDIKSTTSELVTDYESATIFSKVNTIKSLMEYNTTIAGIDYSGAVIDMPELADFGATKAGWLSKYQFLKVDNNGGFWLKNKYNDTMVYYIGDSNGIGAYAGGPNLTTHGIRLVINNLLKSNIDKETTKKLN